MEEKLNQLTAKVGYLKLMVGAGREPQALLDRAVAELESFKISNGQGICNAPKIVVAKATAPKVVEYERQQESNDYLMRKTADLLADIEVLRKANNVKSNQVAMIPKDVICKDVCQELVGERKVIEELYDQYYHIEKNGCLPMPADLVPEPTVEDKLKLAEVRNQIKSLEDIATKARRKLKSEGNVKAKINGIWSDLEKKLKYIEIEIERLRALRDELS